MSLLGHGRESILGALLTAHTSARSDGARGEGSQGTDEATGVLSALDEPPPPAPTEGDNFADEVGLLAPAADVTEIDPGVLGNARQGDEEVRLNVVERRSGRCDHGTAPGNAAPV